MIKRLSSLCLIAAATLYVGHAVLLLVAPIGLELRSPNPDHYILPSISIAASIIATFFWDGHVLLRNSVLWLLTLYVFSSFEPSLFSSGEPGLMGQIVGYLMWLLSIPFIRRPKHAYFTLLLWGSYLIYVSRIFPCGG
ncbi:MAG: hypothetical protein KDD53_00350 [Bdellovibrionales bacterium]|nr:hypothetical protein [Bdellovibrionales bacterium]